jgi:hypothetical protein
MDFTDQLREKLAAAEGELDRLRGLVAEIARPNGILCRTCGDTVVRCAADSNPGDECPGKLARASLAATPHTEGEASAPKDKLGST